MASKKTTRRALFSSLMSLLLCVSMLVGSTFAWFTDSVTSSGNIIKSGNLDVEMYWADGKTNPENTTWKDASEGAIFNYNLWEPGYTEVRHIKIANEGTLALKYQIQIKANGEVSELADVIDVYYADPAVQVADRAALAGKTPMGTLTAALAGMSSTAFGTLEAGASDTITLALKMQESAGNEYQGKSIGSDFSVVLLATQLTSEEDSFGSDYDALAAYPGSGLGQLTTGASAVEIPVYSTKNSSKVGTATVPAGAVKDPNQPVEAKMTPSDYVGNITVDTGHETLVLDIKVENLDPDNTEPIKVKVFIGEGLDPATVKLYHYDTEIPCDYNPYNGYVTFESATFSPFTIVYDAESEYEAPEVDEDTEHPKAIVTYESEYVNNNTLVWGNYGQWSPTEGLEANLEAAFKFACPDEVYPAYENWYCDFFVSLDKDLGENQIFLGGNYGDFGWVGFHNGDLTLEANTELPLLSSVTSNPWTYSEVKSFVGEFLCGVGDVDDALEGATFTVKLRLTNPENEKDFIDTNVVTHTFGGNSVIDGTTVVTTGEGLQDAINNGDTNIELGGDIDLSQGIVIP